MAKKVICGNKIIYQACEKLFSRLYKESSVFKSVIDKDKWVNLINKDGGFYIGSVKLDMDIPSIFSSIGINGFNSNKILSIVLSDVYKYRRDFGNLYAGGTRVFIDTLDGSEIVTMGYRSDDLKLPPKDEVLIKKGRNPNWGNTEDLKPVIGETLSSLDSLLGYHNGYTIAKLYMRNDDLVLGYYGLNESIEVKYGENKNVDVFLEALISFIGNLNLKVERIYWFIQDSYKNVRVRKTSADEFSLFIS